MLYVRLASVREDQKNRFRQWFADLPSRKAEAEATYQQEGTRAEAAYFVEGESGTVLVHVMEVANLEQARDVFQQSQIPIDLEFKALMQDVANAPCPSELLYEYPASAQDATGRIAIRPIHTEDREWVRLAIAESWGSLRVVVHGVEYRPEVLPGFIAEDGTRKIGLITYHAADSDCEVVTLNSLAEGRGAGTKLLNAVADVARKDGCQRVWLVTTNDNLRAIRFYQKRGFELAAVHRAAVAESRKVKPEIPLTGEDGIPIRDEIELELALQPPVTRMSY
jgi:ribosomal protein S18 acetylase RimI-like enzyme